ncbi:hypothetical protein [Rhodoferax saidenbachensis]|uniref:Uncharacterized protein n=1 Tax=Rhodoferax saidenbachensis TaxID=1484693 RepID=A0ABU1ZRR7_9BURK|nr:hypothetical protein [Rhodoferax saidenbachensis]MDR7308233.1 hypothetical protein [Rhodoferax saidenbachensis]
MSLFEKFLDVFKTEVPGIFEALYYGVVVVAGAALIWGIYARYDAHFIRGFEERAGQPRLTITSADDATWLLNFDNQKLATLAMESPHSGIYDFKVVSSQDPSLEVGAAFKFQKPSITNDLICQNCEQATRSRLPLLWRVAVE